MICVQDLAWLGTVIFSGRENNKSKVTSLLVVVVITRILTRCAVPNGKRSYNRLERVYSEFPILFPGL